jgi:NAD(P)H-dependent FMN reductase
MLNMHVIAVSTRPGRVGFPVATWIADRAREHGGFEVRLVDLKEVNLPVFDEPRHPRLKQYENAHTKAWSEIVGAADAFVFVTPEYNFSVPPSLVNALDFLSTEWAYKPAAFVSYGGASGGVRSVQMAKMLMTSLKMMPIPESVAIAMFQNHLDEKKVFVATEAHLKSSKAMLDELVRWAGALRVLRV